MGKNYNRQDDFTFKSFYSPKELSGVGGSKYVLKAVKAFASQKCRHFKQSISLLRKIFNLFKNIPDFITTFN